MFLKCLKIVSNASQFSRYQVRIYWCTNKPKELKLTIRGGYENHQIFTFELEPVNFWSFCLKIWPIDIISHQNECLIIMRWTANQYLTSPFSSTFSRHVVVYFMKILWKWNCRDLELNYPFSISTGYPIKINVKHDVVIHFIFYMLCVFGCRLLKFSLELSHVISHNHISYAFKKI